MISLDTECSGVDFNSGTKPFYVTLCDDKGMVTAWEWDVDPLTREPTILDGDTQAIRDRLAVVGKWSTFNGDARETYSLIGQNSRFDAAALRTIGVSNWPWEMTHDTLIASHILASNQPHDLTSLALHYLGVNIKPLEDALEQAVKQCRRLVQQARLKLKRYRLKHPEDILLADIDEPFAAWRIAEDGLPEMPSATGGSDEKRGKIWRADYWLPRAVVMSGLLPESQVNPEWLTVLSEYSNADSSVTLLLWSVLRDELRRRGLWDIYVERMKLVPIALGMETRGVTLSRKRLQDIREVYQEQAESLSQTCLDIAAQYNYELTLPKSGNNHSLLHFCFGRPKEDHSNLFPSVEKFLDLPIVGRTETGNPALNKGAMDEYRITLPSRSLQRVFVEALADKRKRDKDLADFEQYERYWHPIRSENGHVDHDTYVLHPNMNMVGTDTLRWSFSRPNSANIKKDEAECKKCEGEGCKKCNFSGIALWSVRRCFGPAPSREWWSLDFKNVELRIPAYESGEQELIDLFEHPDDPPYYGSQHLLNFSTIYQDIWEAAVALVGFDKVGPYCKKHYSSTYYQWCKNGDFAIQYGAQKAKADATFHRVGAFDLLKSRFRKQEALNQKQIRMADKMGYVETIPDRSIDPRRGYPLMCTRTEWGKVMPTVPLAYHVSGTAMWLTARGMVRCEEQLQEWQRRDNFDGWMAFQVHDELVFDFPKRRDPKADKEGEKTGKGFFRTLGTSNLWRVRVLQRLMEQGGKDLVTPVPAPVGAEYHEEHWAHGETL